MAVGLGLIVSLGVLLANAWFFSGREPLLTKEEAHGRMLVFALQNAAIDNENQELPRSLDDLVSASIPAESLEKLRYYNADGEAGEWLYIPGGTLDEHPHRVVLVSPPLGGGRRGVVRCDGSHAVLEREAYGEAVDDLARAGFEFPEKAKP